MSAKELNIGDYVRTLEYIRKIRKIKDNYVYCDIGVFEFNEIIKSSPNIIDLIEVGDYVNGYLVTDVYKPDGNEVFRIEIERDTLKGHIIDKSSQIKSIVTKKLFSQIEYNIGE